MLENIKHLSKDDQEKGSTNMNELFTYLSSNNSDWIQTLSKQIGY